MSAGAKFEPETGVRYLYVDEAGIGSIAKDVPQTSHLVLGSTSKAAGEAMFVGDTVYVNEATGHGARNIQLAVEFFQALGYEVQPRPRWSLSQFPNQLPAGGIPESPPARNP